jgi:hypothetical protein
MRVVSHLTAVVVVTAVHTCAYRLAGCLHARAANLNQCRG